MLQASRRSDRLGEILKKTFIPLEIQEEIQEADLGEEGETRMRHTQDFVGVAVVHRTTEHFPH